MLRMALCGWLAVLLACNGADQRSYITGISLVAAPDSVQGADVAAIRHTGAQWVSLMPYGFVDRQSGRLVYNSDRQWWGETDEGIRQAAARCRAAGLRLMLKPHIWLRHGSYTGHWLPPDSIQQVFEESFREYVLHYAGLAQELEAEIFCLGTEWQTFVQARPQYWRQLIKEVRAVYSGKLTYAANWDEYQDCPLWKNLDFIGVNAYFPLSDKEKPTKEDLRQGWQRWKTDMATIATRIGKPVLFTEYGYRSRLANTSKPWEAEREGEVSLGNQQLAYRVMFEEVWTESWVAGGFVWKWFVGHKQRGGRQHNG
ncbi:MAG TPA: glycoside hydrolase, partial [Flammeovirgaceae bacterium]|nr:glycoside hydrolase [Flammeovirgaceae bacterium]